MTRDLVDPELLPLLEAYAGLPDFTPELLPAIRAGAAANAPAFNGAGGKVLREERHIPGPEGAPDVRILIYRPAGQAGQAPAILHMHGGGYLIGSPEMNTTLHQELVAELGCVIVSVDYRLAPETAYPGAVEDGYAALKWLHEEAETLGVDRARIGVSGESAGGGLAAALALLARDRGEVPFAFQHLIVPMIDDRTCVTADPHPHTGEYVWTTDKNRSGWSALLGREPGGADVPIYAAAARATDLAGLPPTYISSGALDLFLDENVDYALRLTRAGVPTELHVYPGAYHGFQGAVEARVTKQAQRDGLEALRRFFFG